MKWTKEKCEKESKKYNTKKEFNELCNGAYQKSYREKWLNEICSHMTLYSNPKNYWTKEKCQEDAIKYKSRSEFQKNSTTSYQKSLREGWIDEICSHMIYIGNRYKRCIYAYEFEDNHVYVGLTYNLNERNSDHLCKINSQVYKHKEKTKFAPKLVQLTDYIDVENAKIKEGEYVEKYKSEGWNILNKAKTGNVGGSKIIKYTKEICLEISLKYNKLLDFRKEEQNIYRTCIKQGWLDEISTHMEKSEKWNSIEKCNVESLKYDIKSHFKKLCSGAYDACLRNGWIDIVCSHMNIKKHGYWNDYEKCKNESLKYNKVSHFKKNSSGAYDSCLRNGWINDFFLLKQKK